MNCATRSFFARKFGIVVMAGFLIGLACARREPWGKARATKEFQKTLTLGTGQTVSLTNKYGDVHIHGDNGRDVKISANIRVQAHSQAEADRYADQVRIDVAQDSGGIRDSNDLSQR